MFFTYFIFTAATLLNQFSNSLQIIYYPMTNIIFIILLFVIAVSVVCSLNFSSVVRTNLIVLPIVIFSIIFLFIANTKNFSMERLYPVLGNGFNSTFIAGFWNLFAFGGLSLLYFIPPNLKDYKQFKKITLISMILSSVYLLLSISITLLMFDSFIEIDELMPLYSAVRYLEFGTFFQRLDSVFLLTIISNLCINIFRKLTNVKNTKIIVYPFALLLFAISLIPTNIATSNFFGLTIYKYMFFILVLLISISILIIANIKNKIASR